jgi:hypothetical protein
VISSCRANCQQSGWDEAAVLYSLSDVSEWRDLKSMASSSSARKDDMYLQSTAKASAVAAAQRGGCALGERTDPAAGRVGVPLRRPARGHAARRRRWRQRRPLGGGAAAGGEVGNEVFEDILNANSGSGPVPITSRVSTDTTR